MDYVVNNIATINDFLNHGFSWCDKDTVEKKEYVYNRDVILRIIVDFSSNEESEDPWIHTHLYDAYSGRNYVMYQEYGRNLVKEKVRKNYMKIMRKLEKDGLIKKV